MPIPIGARADHGFDEPLGLLSDCHRRIESFLEALLRIAAEAGDRRLPAEHRTAVESSLKYFASSAPKHTADEEASLFPRLRRSADPALREALASLDRLEHDHDEADAHHAIVDALGREWLESGTLSPADLERIREHLAKLQSLYKRHIALEDHEVFPAAARALDRTQIGEIGREMAARRNVAFKP